MPQTTAYRPTPTSPTSATDGPPASTPEVIGHTDELLDEIDDLLEENALEVVRAYHQRGGQ